MALNIPSLPVPRPENSLQAAIQAIANYKALNAQDLQNQQRQIQNQYLPQQMQDRNALMQGQVAQTNITNQYLPQTLAAQNALRAAQAKLSNFNISNPLLMEASKLPGVAGQQLALQALKTYNPDAYAAALKQQGIQNERANSYLSRTLDANDRAYIAAIARSAGIPYNEFLNRYTHGETSDQIIRSYGLDPAKIKAKYAPTTGARTRIQQQSIAGKGLDIINNAVAEGQGQYGGLLTKFTRPWLVDAYSGNAPQVQKALKYYVSQALGPELVGLRARQQGGTLSAAALQEMTPRVYGRIEAQMDLVPGPFKQSVMMQTQKILDQALDAEKGQATSSDVVGAKDTASYQGPSDADLAYTAKQYGMTVDQVKKKLGIN